MGRSLFCLILVAVAAWSAASAAGSPTQPTDTWVYPYFEELRLREGGPGFFTMTGPYDRQDLARWLAERAAADAAATPRSSWLGLKLAGEFAPETALAAGGGRLLFGSARLGSRVETDCKIKPEALFTLAGLSDGGLSLWTRLRVTANWPTAHAVETKLWRDHWRASFDQGGVAMRRGPWSIFAGRDGLAWSPTPGLGLVLNGAAPAFDMVKLSVVGKHVAFTSLHSQLRTGEADPWYSPGGTLHRYLSGHRLEVIVGPNLNLAVSEVVVYGGLAREFEFGYLNPLGVFYAEQWNSGREDNILISVDGALLLPGRAEVRAEVVADDFQIDPGSEPHKMGLGMSVTAVNPLGPATSLVGLTYCLVTNRTYGHKVSWNRFTQEGHVMGFPGGPDADRLEVWSSAALGDCYHLKVAYTLERSGEGRVDDPQDGHGGSLRFPSGTVESNHTVAAEASWRPSGPLLVTATAEWWKMTNAGNVDGADDDGLRLILRLAYDLRSFRLYPDPEARCD
jgi:hypothetical protein